MTIDTGLLIGISQIILAIILWILLISDIFDEYLNYGLMILIILSIIGLIIAIIFNVLTLFALSLGILCFSIFLLFYNNT